MGDRMVIHSSTRLNKVKTRVEQAFSYPWTSCWILDRENRSPDSRIKKTEVFPPETDPGPGWGSLLIPGYDLYAHSVRQAAFPLSSTDPGSVRIHPSRVARLLFRLCRFNRASSSAMQALELGVSCSQLWYDAVLFFDEGERRLNICCRGYFVGIAILPIFGY